jgi:hypothetical protein
MHGVHLNSSSIKEALLEFCFHGFSMNRGFRQNGFKQKHDFVSNWILAWQNGFRQNVFG